MTNEELKYLWSQQSGQRNPIKIPPEFIWQLAQESARFERAIFWRDTREWLATVFAAGVFLFIAFQYRTIHWLLVVAALITCLPMTYVAFRRPQARVPDGAPSLINHLRTSIANVQHQIELRRSLLWWYLAPLALSGTIVLLDIVLTVRMRPDAATVFGGVLSLGAVMVAVFFGTWKLNQRRLRKYLKPRLQELEKTFAELA